ncbi:Uncharacterised protein [Mycobacteroides abscessus subsp. abscessus]|nr:Uncharacterised protein [Mycobacteroides abscessus subsp. abscessus]
MAWALVPPYPNPLTAIVIGTVSDSYGCASSWTCRLRSAKGMSGLSSFSQPCGGRVRWVSASADLMTPAMPEAASVCPRVALSEPTPSVVSRPSTAP